MANQGNTNKANSSSKFMSYFYKTVQPVTLSIEKMRQKYFNLFKVYATVATCIWLVLLLFFAQPIFAGNVTQENLAFIFVGSGFFFVVFIALPYSFLRSNYSNNAKKTILPVLLQYWGEFYYHPAYNLGYKLYTMLENKKRAKGFGDEFSKGIQYSDISINDFVLERLLYFDNLTYDDEIIGIFNDIRVEFSELETYYITRDSKGRTSKHTTFDGMVFSAKLNKKFKGTTALSYENIDKNRLASTRYMDRQERFEDVILEDPEFTKRFKMASTDQIEARYIFTTAFMERFMKVAQRYNYRVKAIFIDENVHILIDTLGKNWFEFSLSKPCTNFTSYQEFLTDFTGLLSIVDTLKLSEDAVL